MSLSAGRRLGEYDEHHPSRGFQIFVLAATVSVWALIVVGGVVRITESGLGCPDWPLCEGEIVPESGTEAAIEFSHRAIAALVTVLILGVATWTWRRYRSRTDLVVPAIVSAVLVPWQAMLGAAAVWLELPGWIVGVHFMVGVAFLAATVTLAVVAAGRWETRARRGFVRLSWLAASLGLLLLAAGATVVATHADEACGREWPTCNGAFVAGGSDAVIQVTHRTLAYAVAALAIALLVLAWRGWGPRLLGSLPLVAVVVQTGFGISIVLVGEEGQAHAVLAALHVAGAGVVWGSLVALAAVCGRVRPASARLSVESRLAVSDREDAGAGRCSAWRRRGHVRSC